jgi:hypothetical protein
MSKKHKENGKGMMNDDEAEKNEHRNKSTDV